MAVLESGRNRYDHRGMDSSTSECTSNSADDCMVGFFGKHPTTLYLLRKLDINEVFFDRLLEVLFAQDQSSKATIQGQHVRLDVEPDTDAC